MYPWDFFAIHWRAWAYCEVVPRLLGVPVYDLIFIFTCTVLRASLFSSGGDRFRDLQQHRSPLRGEAQPDGERHDEHETDDEGG